MSNGTKDFNTNVEAIRGREQEWNTEISGSHPDEGDNDERPLLTWVCML